MSFWSTNFQNSQLFLEWNILKLSDKIILKSCLVISKTINNFLLSLFNSWFTFSWRRITMWHHPLREKCIRSWSYSGPHFPAFGLNTEIYSVSLRIRSEWGAMHTRINPNTNTFYTVLISVGTSLDTGRKLTVPETFQRHQGWLLNVLCTFHLHTVPRGDLVGNILYLLKITLSNKKTFQGCNLQKNLL